MGVVSAIVLSLAVGHPALGQSDGPGKAAATKPTATTKPGPAAVDVDPNGIIQTYNVQEQDIRHALRLLGFQAKQNIIPSPNVKGTVTLTLYNVTFEDVLEAVVTAVGGRYRKHGNFIYVYTAKEFEELEKAKKRMEVKHFRLWYARAADVLAFIKPALSESAEVATTPAAAQGVPVSDAAAGGDYYASNDMLVIRDFPENLVAVAKIIREVDVKPQQVLIEATILIARLDENSALGVNFNALAGVSFRNLNSSLVDGGVEITQGAVTAPDWNFGSAGAVRTDFDQVEGGLRVGFVSNKISVFLSALETVSDTTVLANPKLLVVDRQRGEVLIGERQGYLTTTVSEGISSQTVEFLETGTRLIVRPYVCKDGHIRMDIHPEESIGALDAAGLPNEATTEVTSNVIVRDGHTIVIGGLFREEMQDTRHQVPVLGNVPYLGPLFRSNSDVTRRSEIIILITPHIIQQGPDEAVGEQLRDDIERFRIGQRMGMQWWSRGRLAGSMLRSARAAIQAGDREKAMWYVDMALSMNPTMEEAIRLKERMTARSYWAGQPQYSSIRYVIQQMLMAELGKPYRRVTYPRRPRNAANIDPQVRKMLGMRALIEDPLPGPPPPLPPPPAAVKGQLQVKTVEK
jgi:type IV pilus assembly protein PilQ